MQSSAGVGGRLCPPALTIVYINAPEVPTRHTHKWDGLNTRHLLESTHTQTHTHTQTNTQRGPMIMRTHAVAAPSSPEEGASPPPPARKLHLCRDLPRRSYVHRQSATERRCACSASHVDVDQLNCLRSRTAVSLACSAPCPASVGRAAPPARSSRLIGLEEQHQQPSPCPSVTARGRIPASCTRRSRRRCGAKSCHYPRRQQCP